MAQAGCRVSTGHSHVIPRLTTGDESDGLLASMRCTTLIQPCCQWFAVSSPITCRILEISCIPPKKMLMGAAELMGLWECGIPWGLYHHEIDDSSGLFGGIPNPNVGWFIAVRSSRWLCFIHSSRSIPAKEEDSRHGNLFASSQMGVSLFWETAKCSQHAKLSWDHWPIQRIVGRHQLESSRH